MAEMEGVASHGCGSGARLDLEMHPFFIAVPRSET